MIIYTLVFAKITIQARKQADERTAIKKKDSKTIASKKASNN